MSSKIQGEGDYEAARRFNKAEQEFVKRKLSKKHARKGNSQTQSNDEMDEHDEISDGDTTQRAWRPGIEFPDRK